MCDTVRVLDLVRDVTAAAEPAPSSEPGEELVRRLENVFYAIAAAVRKKPGTVISLGNARMRMTLRPDRSLRDPEIILDGMFRYRLVCPSLSGYSHVPKLFLMEEDDEGGYGGSVPFHVDDTLNKKFLNRILLAYQATCLSRSRWSTTPRTGSVPAPAAPGRFRPGHGRPR